ncbi:Exocyst component Exo84, C-terminal [Dillenia turbinata]|uniref:Exocyst component Exo84, C-terminal n=1 Tax=Dillenia turbinata TaxID=194707 RepID=A0AAN8VA78_9MAGN
MEAKAVSTQSRPTHHYSSSSLGDSIEFDGGLTLSDRLKAFKSTNFDPDAYVTSKCQAMSEKEIRHLFSYLENLKKASAEEMRISVYSNYAAFIRTSKEISDLEGELLSMRNLLSTQAALVGGLAEGVHVPSLTAGADESEDQETSDPEIREPSKMEKWLAEFLDSLEVLMAEKRVNEAMKALNDGENKAEVAKYKQTLSPAAILSLQTAITEQRQKLADWLAESAYQPSINPVELRVATIALKKLGDSHRAHTLLLNSHTQRLNRNMQSLRPSATSLRGASTASLSQLFFSAVAQAANDSLAVFGEEHSYASELVTWAVKQTENFGSLVKKHVLASSAAAGGIRAAVECIQLCLGHCSLLEARGLSLSPVLLRIFRPSMEQALSANLKRIEQTSAALAAVDDWSLAFHPVGLRFSRSTTSLGIVNASQPKLSSSAHRFNSMVQEIFEDVGPLESLQMGGPTLEGLLEVFNSYINLLKNALPGSMENEENLQGSMIKIVSMAVTESQQVALLANASLLAEDLLPRAAMKLTPLVQGGKFDEPPSRRASERQSRCPVQRDWKKRLQRSVDQLRDSFCRQHALELIFTENAEVRLTPLIYTSMDGSTQEPEWFPSPIFQELFGKLTRMATIAADMFVGRERFATVLLMRLIETVIIWLSDDQGFWEEIESGPAPLGPLGLQQFYLDMEFVLLFASQGRYLSRHLHQVIKNIIARAIEAVAATGIDPYSVLPEDEWFADVAQIAIKMLLGKANFDNVEQEVSTPTAAY